MLISQTSSEYHSVSVLLSWLVTSRFLLSSFVGALTIALPQHNPLKRRRLSPLRILSKNAVSYGIRDIILRSEPVCFRSGSSESK